MRILANPGARPVALVLGLLLAALVSPTSESGAQDTKHPPGWKDPATAQLLGVLGPGWGQLYVGGEAEQRGWYAGALGYGALSIGFLLAKPPACDNRGVCTHADYHSIYWGVGGYLGATIAALSEAGDDARQHNVQRSASRRTITPIIGQDRVGHTEVGLILTF